MFIEPMTITLDAYLKRIDNEFGIGAYNALLVLCRLDLCLCHMYQYGIVHNDLKPDNVMIKDETRPNNVRLIDFGESFVGMDVMSSSPVCKKGNLHYKHVLRSDMRTRAPELAQEYADVRVINASRADVWSLGMLAYTVGAWGRCDG